MCDEVLHEEFKSERYDFVNCPICGVEICGQVLKREDCCQEKETRVVRGRKVCVKCGVENGYVVVPSYIDYAQNMYKINRKTIYNRKYRIQNVLIEMVEKGEVELNGNEKEKIQCILKELGIVTKRIGKRRRMIDFKFIFEKVFEAMNVKYNGSLNIKVDKHLKFKKWWNRALEEIRRCEDYKFCKVLLG